MPDRGIAVLCLTHKPSGARFRRPGDELRLPVKKRLRELLDKGHFDQIAETAGRKRRVLGFLVSLTFDPEPLIGWRAVEAMGVAAHRIAEDDPDFVRQHLRRLHWLLSEESGGVCWRAPEAMAEIVHRRPVLFSRYVPIVISLLREMADEDLVHFRAVILWAIGRLGALARDHIEPALPRVILALNDTDPQVRGMAVWCLGRVGRTKLLADRPNLVSDEGPVDHYEDGLLSRTSVRDLVRRTLRDEPAEG